MNCKNIGHSCLDTRVSGVPPICRDNSGFKGSGALLGFGLRQAETSKKSARAVALAYPIRVVLGPLPQHIVWLTSLKGNKQFYKIHLPQWLAIY